MVSELFSCELQLSHFPAILLHGASILLFLSVVQPLFLSAHCLLSILSSMWAHSIESLKADRCNATKISPNRSLTCPHALHRDSANPAMHFMRFHALPTVSTRSHAPTMCLHMLSRAHRISSYMIRYLVAGASEPSPVWPIVSPLFWPELAHIWPSQRPLSTQLSCRHLIIGHRSACHYILATPRPVIADHRPTMYHHQWPSGIPA